MNVPTAASVSAMQAALLQQQVSIATLSKAQDAMESQGEAAIALLDAALELAEAQLETSGVDIVA